MVPWVTQIIITSLIRKIRDKFKEKRMFKGKLTYGALGAVFSSLVAAVLGDGVVSAADWKELGEAAVVLVAIYGRWRATKP